LYIVREIVVAKGGTVEVASTAEDGTTFTVRIPRFLPVEGGNRDAKQRDSTPLQQTAGA
jgi:K+-sensing histidine kinase KdpD